MARIFEPSAAELAGWRAWVAARPEKVRAVAERFDPWSLYRLKTTGQRVTVFSFGEPENEDAPVTLTVAVSGRFNLVLFDRRVFGIDPDDLEPCELPIAGEPLGTALNEKEARDYIDATAREVESRRRGRN